jgi:hypothetical protein
MRSEGPGDGSQKPSPFRYSVKAKFISVECDLKAAIAFNKETNTLHCLTLSRI